MWASRHIKLIIFLIQSSAFSPTFSLSCAFSFGSLATRIYRTAVRNALANIAHSLSLIFCFPLILDDIPISPPRPLSSSPEIAVGRSKVSNFGEFYALVMMYPLHNRPINNRPRGNRAKHLVRVATEYTQLLYHVSKAQADARSAFVDEIQWVCELSLFNT
jgi:hypothetical protein